MKKFTQIFLLKEETNQINGFVILKPEFLDHEDEFIKLLNNNGWNIVQKQKRKLSDNEAKELYKMHKDKDFYNDLCKYMCSDDCLCCQCYKDCKDPIKDMNALKDKVRKTWGKDEMKNAMHSSDSLENVNRESKLIFEKKVIESVEDDLQIKMSQDEINMLIKLLENALAEEFLAWYHYTITAPFLVGSMRPDIEKLFKETAKDEFEDHACWLMERLKDLGTTPGSLLHPSQLDNIAQHKYIMPSFDTLTALTNNIEAEKGAIETYTQLESYTKDKDIVTHAKIEEILADEQEHLKLLNKLFNDIENETIN